MKRIVTVLTLFLFMTSPAFAGIGLSGGGGGASGDADTIKTISVVAPAAGDDGKYLQYEHSTPAQQFQYATPPGGGDMTEAVWDGDADGYIDADAGGTDINTSASTGVPSISAGTWSVGATLTHELGGLEADVSAYSGLVKITGGATSAVTVTAFAESILDDANEATFKATANLEAGTDFYAVSAADAAFEAELDNSAGLLAALSDETGTGVAVFGTAPTLTAFTLGGDITSTGGAYDWDLVDNNAAALSLDAVGQAGIISVVTTNGSEGVTMSGTLAVTGAVTSTGLFTATAAGANITFADGQLMDGSGITHTGATDEGWVLPTWADVSPSTDQPYVAWDATGNALKIYDGGWLTFATAAAPLDAKYIVQQADATLTDEQSLGALASGILYSTTTTGVISIATEAQMESTLGIGFGASKVATDDYILVADGVDFESVAMSGDATMNNGVVTVADDSHAHVYSDIDATTSANWAGRVSDETGTGLWVFATAPTFTTSIAFNAVTDTVAGIQNQNLVDKTAAENISGDWEWQDGDAIVAGTDADWDISYDEAGDDRLEFVNIVGTSGDSDVYWDLNDTADSTFTITNSDATGEANLVIEGDITYSGQLIYGGAADQELVMDPISAWSPSDATKGKIAFEGSTAPFSLNFWDGSAENTVVHSGSSVTWDGTTHSFASVTNLVLPTNAADASGEISMSAGNQLTWHDGTKTVIIDTTVTTDNYVLKYDNASATFNLEADETGGAPAWSTVADPASDVDIEHGAGEETQFTYTGNFTTGNQFNIQQLTGNPSGGVLFNVQASDSNVTLARFGDGTNYTQISQGGNLTQAGSATATLNLVGSDFGDGDLTSIDNLEGVTPATYLDLGAEDMLMATTLDAATGNQEGLKLTTTVNKASSGDAYALVVDFIDTASPGNAYLVDYRLGGTSVWRLDILGNVVIGGSSISMGTNPSTTGTIRLANDEGISARNNDNTVDVNLLKYDTIGVVAIGQATDVAGVQIETTEGATMLGGDFIRFPDADPTPVATAGIYYDNTITGLDDGGFVWYDDDEIRTFVDLDATEVLAAGDDGKVVQFNWNAGAGYFDLTAAGAGDLLAANNLSDVANAATSLTNLGLTATASEINTPLDGASVTLTEFQELEAIGATTISANQWAALGGISETLTNTELNYLDSASGTTGTGSVAFSASPTFTGTVSAAAVTASGAIQGLTQMTMDTAATVDLSSSTGADNEWRVNNDADAIQYTLPPGAAGLVVCFLDNAGGVISVDPDDGTDAIILDGTSLGAGDELDSPGARGDFACLLAVDGDTWIVLGKSGTWVDGGAS